MWRPVRILVASAFLGMLAFSATEGMALADSNPSDAQLKAIDGHTPQGIGLGVQTFLQQSKGAAAPDSLSGVVAQSVVRSVQRLGLIMRRDHHGHPTTEGAVRHWVGVQGEYFLTEQAIGYCAGTGY